MFAKDKINSPFSLRNAWPTYLLLSIQLILFTAWLSDRSCGPQAPQALAPATGVSPSLSALSSAIKPSQPAAPAPAIAPSVDLAFNPVLRLLGTDPNTIWTKLLDWHPYKHPQLESKKGIVIEIGAYDCKESIHAAAAGFRVLTAEPSPPNYQRCLSNINGQPQEIKDRIRLLNVAGGPSDTTVEFNSIGGTGDHIGLNEGEVSEYRSTNKVKIPCLTLDTLLEQNADFVGENMIYITKIDTQGFDVGVILGAKKTIATHRVAYFLLEIWPVAARHTIKIPVAKGPQLLKEHGYDLFDMSIQRFYFLTEPPGAETQFRNRPLPFDENEQWYLDLNDKSNDKFGWGSDAIATAPLHVLKKLFVP